jgi:hypothetical protein
MEITKSNYVTCTGCGRTRNIDEALECPLCRIPEKHRQASTREIAAPKPLPDRTEYLHQRYLKLPEESQATSEG